ncbi:MAG TPA: malto-oligosyltrehalose synthase [Dongiaceae bacterium]|nr:malto-oligosyltrehalose synthase [Dongiaceae bacterium]
MREVAALNRRLGIEAGYLDPTGKRKAAPRATIEALWRTLLPGEGQAAPDRLLAELDAEESGRIVDPVAVATAGQEIRLRLKRQRHGRILCWEIATEEGDRRRGEQRLAENALLRLPADLPMGYHDLSLSWAGGEASTRLIVAPAHAYLPPELTGDKRGWGLAAQLYALRSSGNWGIGDFSDLSELLKQAAQARAMAVGVNPLHALFPDEPERASPYSPSSRLFLNPLYIDLEAVADFAECEAARALLTKPGFADARLQARQAGLVNYTAVTRLKRQVTALLYRHFRERHLAREDDGRAAAFGAFQAAGGKALRHFAVFEVLRAHMAAETPAAPGWRSWPEAYRQPDSAAVRRFAAEHEEAIELVEYQQWQADLQLAGAAETARAAGMAIGVYRDLAVGFDAEGADAWQSQSAAALDWSVGAPPDAWNMNGQFWGLPPFNPRALRREGYQPLIEMLRANMHHAGALRIDHALGLKRLFWIPRTGGPHEGVYVYYPMQDMLGIVALESQRNHCLVVGEDLGTVPPGFSETLQARGILSYRLLYFMRGAKGEFLRPSSWPREALAQVSTHDLPTLRGFWSGQDIETKKRLSLFPDKAAERAELRDRPATLKALRTALAREGLPATGKEVPVEPVHRFLARSRSRLAMLQLEDLAGSLDQINMPGTIDEHPNWRRKLPRTIAELVADPDVASLLSAVEAERDPTPARKQTQPSSPPGLRATYRLQLTSDFGFEAAMAELPYLAELGISHVYLSPILEAQPGSGHGYDGTSYERINPDLGGAERFDKFSRRLSELGLGLILDFVPNHMGIGGSRNRWWLELLEWGPGSPAAEIFDVDWAPPWPELKGKILVPLLGDSLDEVLARGELPVRFDQAEGRFDLWYFDNRFPLRPQDYGEIIRALLPESVVGAEEPDLAVLRHLAKDFTELPAANAVACKRAADMQTALALLAAQSPAIAKRLHEAATASQAPERLDPLLERQHYRLAHWRLAATRANYRRFFDIAQLCAVRMERPEVFERFHGLIGRLIAEGKLDGLRLDHVDGLKDPAAYCRRLRRFVEKARAARPKAKGREPFYLTVEKILGSAESLRKDWPIQGTTGYEFIALSSGLFTDPASARPLQRLAESLAGDPLLFPAMLAEAKGQVIDSSFGADLERLAVQFHRLAPQFERDGICAALRRIAIGFPVYRSYVSAAGAAPEDRRLIDHALASSMQGLRGSVRQVHVVLGRCLKVRTRAAVEATMRFQQFTAPVMAKGLEDTVFYRYPRLASLNEVGGAPEHVGTTPAAAHRSLEVRRRDWPLAMSASATHDTKRGEDSRARLNVLSEIPEQWERRVRRWSRMNRGLKRGLGKEIAPSGRDEYFIYQGLVGTWPIDWLTPGAAADLSADALERIKAYLVKALREAKHRTSWLEPNADYEQACLAFLEGMLDRRRSLGFIEDIASFLREIAPFGMLNGLAQTVLKLTAPGIPDIYQGTELWDLSLVDPDNRRPVDFARRREMLRATPEAWEELLGNWQDGRVKLRLLAGLLALRRDMSGLFTEGSYEPLGVSGAAARHIFAFRRRQGRRVMIVAIGRFFARLAGRSKGLPIGGAWASTHLLLPRNADTSYRDALTGQRIAPARNRLALDRLFERLPVAVLTNELR